MILGFGVLVFNEVLVLNLFGLERNTKQAIAMRLEYQEIKAQIEIKISDDSIEETETSKQGKTSIN